MCRFLSAIVMPTGDVKCEPMIDSHSVLIKLFTLRDDAEPKTVQRVAKIEFVPPEDRSQMLDLDQWSLVVDEDTRPDWWPGVADKVLATMRRIVSGMIVTDHREIVVGGCWLIGPGGRIGALRGGRIVYAHPDANLSGADLIRADLHGANLSSADLNGANLNGADLSRANLIRADLIRANLYGADLSSASLCGADLSRANLIRADLNGSNLSRANLSGASLYGAYRPDNPPTRWRIDQYGSLEREEASDE